MDTACRPVRPCTDGTRETTSFPCAVPWVTCRQLFTLTQWPFRGSFPSAIVTMAAFAPAGRGHLRCKILCMQQGSAAMHESEAWRRGRLLCAAIFWIVTLCGCAALSGGREWGEDVTVALAWSNVC